MFVMFVEQRESEKKKLFQLGIVTYDRIFTSSFRGEQHQSQRDVIRV